MIPLERPTSRDRLMIWCRRVAPLLLFLTAGTPWALHADSTARAERAESAGPATVYDTSHNAFGRPLANLPESLWQPMRQGKQIFSRVWLPPVTSAETPSSPEPRSLGRFGRGLGPLFAADRCTACHFKDGREARGAEAPLLFRLGVEGPEGGGAVAAPHLPEPTYGDQLQPYGVAGVSGEGQPEIHWHEHSVRAADGQIFWLRRPELETTGLALGPPVTGTRWSLRAPPTLVGLGLLEAVSESSILAWADPEDRDGDGISGRPQWLPAELSRTRGRGSGQPLLGRFGWKAGQGDLERQAAAALQGDLGVTSSWEPGITGAAPEISDHQLARLALYLRLLAPPARRGIDDPRVERGERLFHEIGCVGCHRPELSTRTDASPEALAGLTLRPYTDLLLHDMGEGLADGLGEHRASASEWRTPPLWGLGLLPVVGDGTVRLLHDGRARTLEEAIVWHGGEAEGSQEAFLAASPNDRQDLIRFLESL